MMALMKFVAIYGIAYLASFTAVAQELPTTCPEKPVDEDSARALAGTWFKKGAQLAEEESYEEALKAFNCSRKMVEHPDTVFNAAQAAYLSGKRETAVKMLRQYLEMAPNGRMTKEAKDLRVKIEKEKQEEEKKQQAALKKRREEEERRQKEAAQAAAAAAKDEEPPAETDDEKISRMELGGYIALGFGGASLVTGAVLQGLAGKAVSDGEKTDDYHGEWKDLKSKMKVYQTGALVGFIVGGVAAGVGITLVLVGKKKNSKVEVSVAPSFDGLSITGNF
ncbi:MAG: tetratricopeptide repeat protein [Deltaproteobacteria bacterium]|nr:tetratricopeptide repeat protein [Deltaproteobacteria bacterium]